MKSSMRARSYAALTINGNGSGSRPDSPLAGQDGNGPSFLLSPPPPFPIIAPRNANGARRSAAATVATVALVLLATVGLLALALSGGGGGGSRRDGAGSLITPKKSRDFPWPPQLEADNAAAGKRGAAVDPAQPPPPSKNRRRLKLVLVVHRHGARTPLVFAYGGTGNGTDSQEDAKIPYSRCLREYPGVGLAFRALAAPTTTPSDDDPLLPPGENVDESEPVMPGDGSCRLGTLTRRGYAQALRLGLWLRARYCSDDGAAAAATTASSQKRLACSAPSAAQTWQLYSSRLRRTVATLRGVLTGLVADEEVTRDLLRALEDDGNNSTTLATTAQLPTFTVSQCATHGAEFMYGKSTSCPALAPLVQAAERDALKTDAREPEALAAARRTCKEVLGEQQGGCASPGAEADDPPVDWRRLRDVVTAMLAERGAKGGLELLPLPPAQKAGGDNKADDGAAQPNKNLLRSLGETMAYAARREARIIAPADPNDRTIALGVGPLVERIRAAVAAESADDGNDNGNEPRFAIYSGHDSTMMPLLTVLGAAEENAAWPPYASSLVFEVWGGVEAAGEAKSAVAALEGRRERAGAGHHPPHHQPSAGDEDGGPLVRVLHDGRLLQERAASELVEALGVWAVDDEARAEECRRGGGGGDGGGDGGAAAG